MRTVWLALFCLIGLATTVVVKIGLSPYASADVSRGVPSAIAEVSRETSPPDTVALSSENVTVGTNLRNDPLTKADKLEVSYTNEAAPEVKSVKSVAIVFPTTEPKLSKKMERIVSRHWHDPLDKRSGPAAVQPPAKRKVSNRSTNRLHMVTARAPKS
jgi:Flp pilus assembly protein CpaB